MKIVDGKIYEEITTEKNLNELDHNELIEIIDKLAKENERLNQVIRLKDYTNIFPYQWYPEDKELISTHIPMKHNGFEDLFKNQIR